MFGVQVNNVKNKSKNTSYTGVFRKLQGTEVGNNSGQITIQFSSGTFLISDETGALNGHNWIRNSPGLSPSIYFLLCTRDSRPWKSSLTALEKLCALNQGCISVMFLPGEKPFSNSHTGLGSRSLALTGWGTYVWILADDLSAPSFLITFSILQTHRIMEFRAN